LRLTAKQDSACEVQHLRWHGGPVLLAFNARHVAGASPRICLWETGPERCASLPPIADSNGWGAFREATTPDVGTNALDLFVYADAPSSPTRNDYANFQVLEFDSLPQFDLVGVPTGRSVSNTLVVQNSSYSVNWVGPADSQHVLVDGLLNGWLISDRKPLHVHYVPADKIVASRWLSIVGLVMTTGLGLSIADWRGLLLVGRRRRSRPPFPFSR
jgi:hypothetical protein